MSKEEIYDSQISPLMAQILKICREHKIAMIADFALDNVDFHATCAELSPDFEPLDNQLDAWKLLCPDFPEEARENSPHSDPSVGPVN